MIVQWTIIAATCFTVSLLYYYWLLPTLQKAERKEKFLKESIIFALVHVIGLAFTLVPAIGMIFIVFFWAGLGSAMGGHGSTSAYATLYLGVAILLGWIYLFTYGASEYTAKLFGNTQLIANQQMLHVGVALLVITESLASAALSYNLASASQSNIRWGVIDKTGTFVIRPTAFDEPVIERNVLTGKLDSDPNVLDDDAQKYEYQSRGSVILDKMLSHTGLNMLPFSEDLALAQKVGDTKFGYVNRNLNFVIQPKFVIARSFKEGMAAARNSERDQKWGFIDKSGIFVIPPIFESAESFSEGLACVSVNLDEKGTRWAFINHRGDYVIKPLLAGAHSFMNGRADAALDLNESH